MIPEVLETLSDLQSAFEGAGVSITAHQLERWRAKGLLLPARQIGLGRGRGSLVSYEIGTAKQAIEICRLLGICEKFSWVGWQLWMQGFPVAERYWRTPLENARQSIAEIHDLLMLVLQNDEAADRDDTIYDRVDIGAAKGSPIYAAISRMPQSLQRAVFRIGGDLFLGDFEGFQSTADVETEERRAVLSALGANLGTADQVLGHSINFTGDIESVLMSLSAAFRKIGHPEFQIERIQIEVKIEFQNSFLIAQSLHHSMIWIFGRNAFGLGVFGQISSIKRVNLRAMMLLIWSEFRSRHGDILPSDKIASLSEAAAGLLAKADELRNQIKLLPPSHPFSEIRQIETALRSDEMFGQLIKSVANFSELTSK